MKKSVLLGSVAVFLFTLVGAAASAEVKKFVLRDVTFADGGTVTGSFDYDAVGLAVVGWTFAIDNGDTTTFPPVTLTSANTTFSSGGGYPQPMLVFDLPGSPIREFRFTPVSSLAAAETSVAIDTVSQSGNGALECFNCNPFRMINAGQLDPQVSVATLGDSGAAALALLIAGLGAFWLVCRRHA